MTKQVTAYKPDTGVLVTGSAGFIGSTFTEMIMKRYPDLAVYAVDSLTYAGFRENLPALEEAEESRSGAYKFFECDIADPNCLREIFEKNRIDTVINFAAETHVDRSLARPDVFFHSNIIGAACLLNVAREYQVARYIQVSTDEVYGSTPEGVDFDETAPLLPSSPYAASKAGADLAVLSYVHSYAFPALIVRGANNYGPRQYPEKLIPFFIARALDGKTLPLYGDGQNERDWIHVTDFCRGIITALEKGSDGAIYNIGADNHICNLDLAQRILDELKMPDTKIEFVADRPGHDMRYGIDTSKIHSLGFAPQVEFNSGFADTVRWYVESQERLRLIPAWDRDTFC